MANYCPNCGEQDIALGNCVTCDDNYIYCRICYSYHNEKFHSYFKEID